MRLARALSIGLVTAGMLSITAPSNGVVDADCYAEVSPTTVVAGTTQAFSVTVYHGPELPVSLPIEPLNEIRARGPVDIVEISSIAGPSPWTETSLIGSDNKEGRWVGGELALGDRETFSVTGDVGTELIGSNLDVWRVRTSRDLGAHHQACSPIRPGSMDIVVVE